MLANALSHLPFDERQKTYASPSHDYGYKHNTQAITSSCQWVLNDELVHIWPTLNSDDTNDIYQLYGSTDHFQSLATILLIVSFTSLCWRISPPY
jgi:hypothetical protein